MTAKKQDIDQKKNYEVGLTIRISKNALVEFQEVFLKYRVLIYAHNFKKKAEKEFFVDTLSYWKQQFGDDFKKANANFLESVKSPGNRRTDRSFPMEMTKSTFFGLQAVEYDLYFDVMFSYAEKNMGKSGFDASVFSTSYFFYDVIDFAKANIKGIANFNIEKEKRIEAEKKKAKALKEEKKKKAKKKKDGK